MSRSRVRRGKRIALALAAASSICASADETGMVYDHPVRSGDTLIRLGKTLLDHPADWTRVQQLNHIANPAQLRPGSVIRIPVGWLRGSEQTARLIALHGQVSVNGRDPAPGESLRAGSTLETGADGFVALRLHDGSRLTLQPGSRLVLEHLRRRIGSSGQESLLVLPRGRIESEVQPQRGPAARYEIRTPSATIGVRGTAFRVATEAGEDRAEVTHGLVAFGATAMPAGFGGVSRAGGAATALPLLPAPDLAGIDTALDSRAPRITPPADPRAAAWHAQIARDPGFTDLLAQAHGTGPQLVFPPIPQGSYWLRLRAVDAAGLEGLDAQREIGISRLPDPPLALSPADAARVAAGSLQFSWRPPAGKEISRIEIAAQADFATVVQREDLAASTLRTRLPPGLYHWRLASLDHEGRPGPWGQVRTIRLDAAVPALEVVEATRSGIRFRWPAAGDARYEFELAEDRDFSRLVVSALVPQPVFVTPALAGGRYWARVRLHADEAADGEWSAPQAVDAPRQWLPGVGD